MNWHNHWNLKDKHAFLSASKHSWINYDEEKLLNTYANWKATEYGTRIHALASELIQLGIKLPRSKQTLNLFVNDAIGFHMESEQTLYYSDNAFGTADAISFRDNMLRIHDLKTGKGPVSMDQLMIYAAFFCLEYHVEPTDIEIELRIYQNDEVAVCDPDADKIKEIMNTTIEFDKLIEKVNSKE